MFVLLVIPKSKRPVIDQFSSAPNRNAHSSCTIRLVKSGHPLVDRCTGMAKKRRLEICEIEQDSQGNLSNGSQHETQSRGVSQPIHPHGFSHPTHFDDPLQTAHVPRASQPYCSARTSRPSNVDVHASERFQGVQ